MKVYGITIQTVETIPHKVLMSLAPERYARSLKYLRREDRLRCLGAGYLMHRVLGIAENELRYGEYGKPFAPGRPEFNLSHGGNWIILGTDSRPVGVDIEPLHAANLDIAKRVFTADELRWMQTDPLPRFHILWTIKESIMKGAGLGMQLDPARFHVTPVGEPHCVNGKTWHAAWILRDGCALACASPHPIDGITIKEILPEKDDRNV